MLYFEFCGSEETAMRKLVLAFALVGTYLVMPVVFAQGFAAYSGEDLYQRFCASCHGPEGRGNGPVASSLAVLVPDLTRLYQRRGNHFPAAEIREVIDGRSVVIAHGTRYMPVWGYEFWVEEGGDVVAEEEARIMIDRLVNFLESIQYAMDPAEPVP
jgi:hypothetical protein